MVRIPESVIKSGLVMLTLMMKKKIQILRLISVAVLLSVLAMFAYLPPNGWGDSDPKGSAYVEVVQSQPAKPKRAARRNARNSNKRPVDAKNIETGTPEPVNDPELASFSRFAATAPMPGPAEPVSTGLPLDLKKGERIAFIGNTLFERAADFGYFESFLQQRFPEHQLVIRNLTWSADEIDLQPRPANFASLDQQLTLEKVDLIFAAFGYNESFAGLDGLPSFRQRLRDFLVRLKSSAFNGKTGPRIVLVSPIANENIKGVSAADRNNSRIKLYGDAMKEIAIEQEVGFADVFSDTLKAMAPRETDLTFNGIHLIDNGYRSFGSILFKEVFHETAPGINESLRQVVLDKNRQYFRRYRPLNTFYYTGGRNKRYGYLDFLPAMRNFDLMVLNREQRIWELAAGKKVE
ncbi:MAG TPA: hypothetical protein EYG38_07275, partial [Verrucomicrobia bacterium]|nr:hypothetical protein [Verrucomicrobiota bacterium]